MLLHDHAVDKGLLWIHHHQDNRQRLTMLLRDQAADKDMLCLSIPRTTAT